VRDNSTGKWIETKRTYNRAERSIKNRNGELKPASTKEGYSIDKVYFYIINNNTGEIIFEPGEVGKQTAKNFALFSQAKNFIINDMQATPWHEKKDNEVTFQVAPMIVESWPKEPEKADDGDGETAATVEEPAGVLAQDELDYLNSKE
jgi:hypothetical protein